MDQQTDPTGGAATSALLRQFRQACLERGWDDGELARRAGVSRTTLYYLRRGVTRRPRAETLKRIAAALELDPRTLDSEANDSDRSKDDWDWKPQPRWRLDPDTNDSEHSESHGAPTQGGRRRFDRRTNPLIEVVRQDEAELFRGWSDDEWDELYSLVGTGGALTEDGVARAAVRINRRRETIRRLQVVLETHLAEVAERMVESLFELTRPQSNLSATESPRQFLADRQPDGPEEQS